MQISRTVANASNIYKWRPPSNQWQLAVLGSPRGGTSMVSGVLRHLSVYMGDKLDPDNLEDQAFLSHRGDRELFLNSDRNGDREKYISDTRKIIRDRCNKHRQWGWKDPLSPLYLPAVRSALPDLRIIAIFRDAAAVSQRESLEANVRGATINENTILDDARVTLDHYIKIVDLCLDSGVPCLLLSYERALRKPVEVVKSIADFLGIDVSIDSARSISGYIRPDRLTAAIAPLELDSAKMEIAEHLSASRLLTQISKALGKVPETKFRDDIERYNHAATLLNAGDLIEAEEEALRLIAHLADIPMDPHSALSSIELGISPRETAISNEEQSLIAGCAFVSGMASQLSGDLELAAFLHHRAYALSRRLAAQTRYEGIEVARTVGAAAAFHWSLAEKQLGNRIAHLEAKAQFEMFSEHQRCNDTSEETRRAIGGFIERAKVEL